MYAHIVSYIYIHMYIYIYSLPNFRYRGKELMQTVFPWGKLIYLLFQECRHKSVEKKTKKMQQQKNGQRSSCTCHLHPRKLTCPLKRDYFNRKYIFQPLIFRGHSLVFQGVPGDSRWNLPLSIPSALENIPSWDQ